MFISHDELFATIINGRYAIYKSWFSLLVPNTVSSFQLGVSRIVLDGAIESGQPG
jgi:hypothetical protein